MDRNTMMPNRRVFCFVARTVMSSATFEALPIVEGTPQAARRQTCRALIAREGRTCWHTVQMQISFGGAVYYASEIVIRAYRAETET